MIVVDDWVYPSPEPHQGGFTRKELSLDKRHLSAITSNFSSSKDSFPLEKNDGKDLLAEGYDREPESLFGRGENGKERKEAKTGKRDLKLIPCSIDQEERRHKMFVNRPEGLGPPRL
jgi:hypothetical protein